MACNGEKREVEDRNKNGGLELSLVLLIGYLGGSQSDGLNAAPVHTVVGGRGDT